MANRYLMTFCQWEVVGEDVNHCVRQVNDEIKTHGLVPRLLRSDIMEHDVELDFKVFTNSTNSRKAFNVSKKQYSFGEHLLSVPLQKDALGIEETEG